MGSEPIRTRPGLHGTSGRSRSLPKRPLHAGYAKCVPKSAWAASRLIAFAQVRPADAGCWRAGLIIRRSWVRAPPAPPPLTRHYPLASSPCGHVLGPLSVPDGRRCTQVVMSRDGLPGLANQCGGLLRGGQVRRFQHVGVPVINGLIRVANRASGPPGRRQASRIGELPCAGRPHAA